MTASFTTNFRLPIPDFMSEPWHAQLQAAIQAVDGLVYKALVANNITLWLNATAYTIGMIRIDPVDGSTWLVRVGHTSAAGPTTFAQDRATHPTYWSAFVSTINPRGAYANNTTYAYYDLVYDAALKIIALCTTAYTSATGPANLNTEAANWAFLAVFPVATTAVSISYDHTASGMIAITAQAAIDEDHADLAAAIASTTALAATVATKAPLASPALIGAPTAPTQAPNDNSTRLSTTAYAAAAIAALFPIVTANLADAIIIPRKLATSNIAMSAVIVNGFVAETQGGNNQTFAIKTLAGTDPSAIDPAYVVFRSTNPALAGFNVVPVTAAVSVTIPTGQALGFTNNIPGRVWVGAINNVGVVELCVINCLTGTNVYPLQGFGIVSTSAVAGAASSGVFYSTTTRASLAFVPLAYFTWEVGGTLAVAGSWNTLPTRGQAYIPGLTPLPGAMVQTLSMTSAVNLTTASGAYQPTNITNSIVMTSSANLVKIMTHGSFTATNGSVNAGGKLGLFRGATQIGVPLHQFQQTSASSTSIDNATTRTMMDAPQIANPTYTEKMLASAGTVGYPSTDGGIMVLEEMMA